jgi:hypothetical protein
MLVCKLGAKARAESGKYVELNAVAAVSNNIRLREVTIVTGFEIFRNISLLITLK